MTGFVSVKHLQGDEQVIFEIFHFRSLSGIENILHDQRVNTEQLADGFHQSHVMQAVDINPGDDAGVLVDRRQL